MKAKGLFIGAALAALVTTSACTTDPETGQRTISKTALGGIGGALGLRATELRAIGFGGPRRSGTVARLARQTQVDDLDHVGRISFLPRKGEVAPRSGDGGGGWGGAGWL